jgi:hypothetical protein
MILTRFPYDGYPQEDLILKSEKVHLFNSQGSVCLTTLKQFTRAQPNLLQYFVRDFHLLSEVQLFRLV